MKDSMDRQEQEVAYSMKDSMDRQEQEVADSKKDSIDREEQQEVVNSMEDSMYGVIEVEGRNQDQAVERRGEVQEFARRWSRA